MLHWYPFVGFEMGLFWLITVLVASLMALFWPIIIIAVAYLIYKQIKVEKVLVPSSPAIRNAEEILSERYAKGELTREQYMQMKDDLKKAA